MKTVSISQAKAKLNEYVDQAVATHEQLAITKNGTPATIMVSVDEWESLQDTLFWLSQGAEKDVRDGLAAHTAGETLSEDEIRQRFNLPDHASPAAE